MRLARILSSEGHTVTSIIRNSEQEQDIKNVSATPRVLSLENDPVYTFTEAFTGQDVVYFSAGAGGKGGAERTKKVDFDGAVKTFEAITAVEGPKPRLILVSCIDVRDTTKVPPHYVSTQLYIRAIFNSIDTVSRTRKTLQPPSVCGKPSRHICIGNTRQTRFS